MDKRVNWHIVGFLQGVHYAKPIHDNIFLLSISHPGNKIAIGCIASPTGDECAAVLQVLYDGMDMRGWLNEDHVMAYKM